jgi:peptidyl-prolyl cis-trans isomerase D
MLQWFRDKLSGTITRLVAIIITLVFILSAGSYFLFNRSTQENKVLATVDNEKITASVVESLYNNVIKNYNSSKSQQKKTNNNNKDFRDFKDPQDPLEAKRIKQQILKDIISDVVIMNDIKKTGFIVTLDQLLDFIKSNSAFQVKDHFSLEKYKSLLLLHNITEKEYQDKLKEHLLKEQFKTSILLTNFITDEETTDFIAKWHQSRKFGYAVIPINNFLTQSISEQEINDYYDKNKEFLFFPEKVSIEYIDVSADQLLDLDNNTIKDLKANPNNKSILEKYYNEHLEYYTLPELINVRHILIADNGVADLKPQDNTSNTEETSTAEKEKNELVFQSMSPQEKAENILMQLKTGKDFVKLAKKYSDDQNSAKEGGNIGWAGRGELDKNFEKAAFELKKPGDISSIIKSKFGYHIIQLIEKRAAKVNSFTHVKDQVAKHYKEEHAQTKLQDIFDQLSNPAMAKMDLPKVADNLKLKVETTEPFDINGLKKGVASYKEVVMNAFNNKSSLDSNILIKISEDYFVFFRVVNKQASRKKTLAEAQDDIKNILQKVAAKQQANEYSQKLASDMLSTKKINKSHKIANNIEWKVVDQATRKNYSNINHEILDIAFTLSKNKPQKIFDLANTEDLGLVVLLDVVDADVKKILAKQPELKDQVKQQLTFVQTYLEQRLYEEDLLAKSKIKRMVDNSN